MSVKVFIIENQNYIHCALVKIACCTEIFFETTCSSCEIKFYRDRAPFRWENSAKQFYKFSPNQLRIFENCKGANGFKQQESTPPNEVENVYIIPTYIEAICIGSVYKKECSYWLLEIICSISKLVFYYPSLL